MGSDRENTDARADAKATSPLRFDLAPAVRANPLGLGLPRRTVRERFRFTSAAVREVISQMLDRHGCAREAAHIEPVVSEGIVRALDVRVEGACDGLQRDLSAFKTYLEDEPEDPDARFFDCGRDRSGFVDLARQGMAAGVTDTVGEFEVRYSVTTNGIFVKEILDFPDDPGWEQVAGKTMFRDYDPASFSEADLDGVFDDVQRYYGLLRDAVGRAAARPSPPVHADAPPQAGDDPWEQRLPHTGVTSDVVVCRWVERDSNGEYSEKMTFHDADGRAIDVRPYTESEFLQEDDVLRWRTLLQTPAFMAEQGDALSTICVRTLGRDRRRTTTLYQRQVRVSQEWDADGAESVTYLPLYEFFCTYGLPELAADAYNVFGVEIDVTDATAVLSLTGRWSEKRHEVFEAVLSLCCAQSAILVVDVRYAADVEMLMHALKRLYCEATTRRKTLRIALDPRNDDAFERQLASALAEVAVFDSVDDALRECPPHRPIGGEC